MEGKEGTELKKVLNPCVGKKNLHVLMDPPVGIIPGNFMTQVYNTFVSYKRTAFSGILTENLLF